AAITAARHSIQQWPISHGTVVLGGADLRVQFTPIDRYEWQELTRRHPPRPDVPQDAVHGYNLTAVVAAFPGITVTDNNGVQLDWAQVWEHLAAAYRRGISESIWAAHEIHPDAVPTDPAEEAALAREMGVTIRELNGATPVTVTFDAEGNHLTTSVTTPRFDTHEKALLLESRRAEHEPRGRHGLKLSEATDPANQFAYQVPPPRQDWAQKKLNEVQAAYMKSHPGVDTDALLWRVERA
ncbi:hypothetical protein, partial [Microbacterium sp.]|uniref:hypothetical protein n=1 Tax=Microbacterium sp. TaxID=51671 RepID=UPI003C76F600